MLKNFSLFQVILMSSFGAFAIAGLVIFAVVTSNQQSATLGDVEIWGTLDQAAFTAVMRQLAETDSRFRSVTYVEFEESEYEERLTEALASASGPDIFVMRHDYTERHLPKLWVIPYETLSVEQYTATFIDGAAAFLSREGVAAIPFAVDPMVMYWNRDVLATSGFAQPPQYWDELFDFGADATKRSLTNAIERSGVALGEYRNINHAKDILALLMLQAGATITSRSSTSELAPSLIVRAATGQAPAESALRFYTDFANPVKTHYSWNRSLPESRQSFGSGNLALYFGYASEEPLIRRINPNLSFAVAPMPQIRNEETMMNAGRIYGFAIAKGSDNPQGALTISFLLSGSEPASQLSTALGIPATRRDVLAIPVPGRDELFNKQALLVRTWIDPNPSQTDDVFRDMIENVTSGAANLAESLQRADRALGETIPR